MKKIISTSVVLTTIVSARYCGVSTDKYNQKGLLSFDKYIDSNIYFI